MCVVCIVTFGNWVTAAMTNFSLWDVVTVATNVKSAYQVAFVWYYDVKYVSLACQIIYYFTDVILKNNIF